MFGFATKKELEKIKLRLDQKEKEEAIKAACSEGKHDYALEGGIKGTRINQLLPWPFEHKGFYVACKHCKKRLPRDQYEDNL